MVLTVQPSLFRSPSGSIQVTQIHETNLTTQILDKFLLTSSDSLIGVAARYGSKHVLHDLALSTGRHALSIRFSPQPPVQKSRAHRNTRKLLQERILCHERFRKVAFDAEKVSTALFFDHRMRITRLIDAQSLSTEDSRTSHACLFALLGGIEKLNRAAVLAAFNSTDDDDQENRHVLRAWAAWSINSVSTEDALFDGVPHINTKVIPEKELAVVAKIVRDADRLDSLKPTKVKNDVAAKFAYKSDSLHVELSRFKTRIRKAKKQIVIVETAIKGRPPVLSMGTVKQARGKQAVLNLTLSSQDAALAKITQVYTVGREDPTSAETARTDVVLGILEGTNRVLSHSLARKIFLNGTDNIRAWRGSPPCITSARPLNASQKKAVSEILSEHPSKVVRIVQGPPGSGKTTVIAAVVTSVSADLVCKTQRGIWLIAHSNVAVKNIAEKLVDVGFLDFRLLVSFDFHFDWHEHLYEKLPESNIIRTDRFKEETVDTSNMLGNCRVLLCTLSTLSNPELEAAGFTRLVPVDMVIIDEASQIEIGDYAPLLSQFRSAITKLVFIGDDNQLAPYGQDDLSCLQSIFEVDNLRRDALFLDTQYRMPTPIGCFISRHVYDNRLKTKHNIHGTSCCRFVDVAHGKEQRRNNSFQNVYEADCVVLIVKRYHSEDKSYRIVTPYDGQRNLIEAALKRAGLPWKDRCFNVDSFQGNEEDHIILSVVRSDKVGFLRNLRRNNVMLSRCKKSMIICTNRAFLSGVASTTLLGTMAAEWGDQAWLNWHSILNSEW